MGPKNYAAFIMFLLVVAPAYADVGLVKPQDATVQIQMGHPPELRQGSHPRNRSHAPEPSTLALFGGGLLGALATLARRAYAVVKRLIDLLGAVAALAVLAPVILMVAAAVKCTSPGPVIFRQIRMGKGGRLFNIYKFRTMRVDAEQGTGPVWASRHDNRLTPAGNFLRKTHLDEIPQFVNVLRGEMSIVGPRPERPFFVEKLKGEIPGYERRLRIKPGITGLAQVCHRADETTTDVKYKVKYDNLYIKRMCLMADLSILYRTLLLVCTGSIAGVNRLKT